MTSILTQPPEYDPSRTRKLVLDLFCGQGGAAAGYSMAGYSVFGIDSDPDALKHYPFPSVEADWCDGFFYWSFAAHLIHASPPCQHYSVAVPDKDKYPDLIPDVQYMLERSGVDYVIENVPGAPLRNPVELCGCMFGLTVEKEGKTFALYRPRLFEASFHIPQPRHRPHILPAAPVMGHGVPGWFYKKHGFGLSTVERSQLMRTSWMTQDGTSEAIPAAFTAYIGRWFDKAHPVR
jgi:DNA (cytosine-5)-methyltransferase 1